MNVEIGQIYRDTYFDKINDATRAHRTIKVIDKLDDGRIKAETLTDCFGHSLPRPRHTRIATRTLRSGYELVIPRPNRCAPAPALSGSRDVSGPESSFREGKELSQNGGAS